MSFSTLSEAVGHFGALVPSKVALASGDGPSLTYGELIQGVCAFEKAIGQISLSSATIRIAILHSDPIISAVTIVAASSIGSSISLDPSMPDSEIEEICKAAEVDVLVSTNEEDRGVQIARNIGCEHLSFVSPLELCATSVTKSPLTSDVQSDTPDIDDLALIVPTSGTTGGRKMALITHRQWLTRASNAAQILEMTTQDRCLTFMPLYHIGGISAGLAASLSTGGTVILGRPI